MIMLLGPYYILDTVLGPLQRQILFLIIIQWGRYYLYLQNRDEGTGIEVNTLPQNFTLSAYVRDRMSSLAV